MSMIGVGCATYLLYILNAEVWVCVIVGFALGYAAGQALAWYQTAKIMDETAHEVVNTIKRTLEEDPDVEVIDVSRREGNGAGGPLSREDRPPED